MSDSTSGFTIEQPVWDDLSPNSERRRRARVRHAALTILYHSDVRRAGERAILSGLAPGRPVPLSRLEPAFEPPYRSGARPLLDRCISRSPLLITREPNGAITLSVRGSRTRLVAEGVLVPQARTCTPEELERGVVLELADRVVLLLHTLPALLPRYCSERLGRIGVRGGLPRARPA